MKTTLIKWACVALAGLFIAGYVYFIRQENKALTGQVAALQAVNAANLATIAQLEALAKAREITLTAWEIADRAITDEQSRKVIYVQKELQRDESFGAWAGDALPDAVKRVFAD